MIISCGFKDWDTRDWILTTDTGQKFLRCPDCQSGIFLEHYAKACGTAALSFCPYCGKHREKQYVAIDVMTGKPFDLKEFIERDVNNGKDANDT